MQKYKLVMLETRHVMGYAELENEADRLVNDAVAEWEAKGYELAGVEIIERSDADRFRSAGIYRIAVHFLKA